VYWEAELGKGRPGWHIECSAMSMKYLGESFDIHAGGVDLIFPHHENEIAQSEAATERKFVTYWLHSEHLLVEGRKMAKSLGNYYTLRDLLEKGYDPRAIRYLLLSGHYREPLNFTFLGLDQAASTISRLDEFHIRLQEQAGPAEPNPRIGSLNQHVLQRFEESLDDDLNLPSALAALFDFIRETNREMDQRPLSEQDAQAGLRTLRRIDQVLGLLADAPAAGLDSENRRLIELREQARRGRDWATADRIRNQLFDRGIILEDTPGGVRWKLRKGPAEARVRGPE
jgi:cysteinyl-tRNA synthetase